ncbi:MAG: helicase-related protein [Bacillota bacterium]|nr:helicase-related protein [Bacillota bacterium]HHT89924.1 ATP-dependent DNA helicase RecQ [Bacillota bacterium]
MVPITDVYSEMLSTFFRSRITAESSIVFFQGFSADFYATLSAGPVKHFRGLRFDSLIDPATIDSGQLVQSFISSSGCVWGFYEELVALANELVNFGIGNKKVYVVKNNLYDTFFPLPVSCDRTTLYQLYGNDSADIEGHNLTTFYSDYKEIDGVDYFAYVNKHYPIDITVKAVEMQFFEPIVSNALFEKTMRHIPVTVGELPALKIELCEGHLAKAHYFVKTHNDDLQPEIEALNSLAVHFGSVFSLDQAARSQDQEYANAHVDLLKTYWGHEAEFYSRLFYKEPAYHNETYELSQGVLVSNVISQCEKALESSCGEYSDVIITAPTGAGKSLFFQLPGIYLHERHNALTIVVCPLLALMKDQIQELHERGIHFATYINSEISYEQRQERLNGIADGQYSIVYLSPELLLSYDLNSLIGDRTIGLFVIDEAHLVTSWGRDFRVDYWFLGDYLERVRRGSYFGQGKKARPFPVLCLTATAVYGGRDDVLQDLQRSLNLNCSAENVFVGYVKRDNIGFHINVLNRTPQKSEKEVKVTRTCQRIEQFISNQEKTIVYFPYVSQIQDVRRELTANYPQTNEFVHQYSGSGMHSAEKNEAYNNFREGDASVMLATKAFGMGINIPDVVNVYHFAPTGTLADYVQEIGRAARKTDRGNAIVDYLPNDMRYAKTLWGLSGLRHYQIKAIMKKLYDLYQTKQSRHLLFSSDTFSHLFEPKDLDMKVKSGLMLLSADLLETYHFRVINVRPKNLFSSHYIVVPNDVEALFMQEYGAYCTRMIDDKPKVTPGYGYQSTVVTTNMGNVFEIDLARVWEEKFEELTFAKFKYHFFNGGLFTFGADRVVPRIKLIITYDQGYESSAHNLLEVAKALQKAFGDLRRAYGGKQFDFSAFANAFRGHYPKKIRREYLSLLLDVFCYEGTDIYEIPTAQWKFIERRKGESNRNYAENVYCMRTAKFGYIERNIQRYMRMAAPNDASGNRFITYLCVPKRGQTYSEYQLVACLLELFGFATYDLVGGRNPQIFVRINDPLKLARISSAKSEYRNRFLTDIEQRHKRAAAIVDSFMTAKLDDQARWSLIENYFLGFDNLVDSQLGVIEAAPSRDA